MPPIEQVKQWALVGPTGRGKTTVLVSKLLDYAEAHPDRYFYTNIFVYDGSGKKDKKHLHPQFKPLRRFEMIPTLRKTMVAVDELGTKFVPSHQWTTEQNTSFSTKIASNIRKWEIEFAWSDQKWSTVDFRIRNNIDGGRWLEPEFTGDGIRIHRFASETDFQNNREIVRAWTLTDVETGEEIIIDKDGVVSHLATFSDEDESSHRIYYHTWKKWISEPTGRNGEKLVWEMTRFNDVKVTSIEYDVELLTREQVERIQTFFDTTQVIPKIPEFNMTDTLKKVREHFLENELKPSLRSISHYEVTSGQHLSGRQKDAILIEVKKLGESSKNPA